MPPASPMNDSYGPSAASTPLTARRRVTSSTIARASYRRSRKTPLPSHRLTLPKKLELSEQRIIRRLRVASEKEQMNERKLVCPSDDDTDEDIHNAEMDIASTSPDANLDEEIITDDGIEEDSEEMDALVMEDDRMSEDDERNVPSTSASCFTKGRGRKAGWNRKRSVVDIPNEMMEESDPSGDPTKKRKYYFVKNVRDGQPAERFRTDILHRIRAGDAEFDLSDDEEYGTGTAGTLRLSDRWREEWNHGVQVPLNPGSLPIFRTAPCDIAATTRSPFQLPRKRYLLSCDAGYRSENCHLLIPPPPLRIYEGDRLDELWLERRNRDCAITGSCVLSLQSMLNLMNAFEVDCYKNIHRSLLTALHSPSANRTNDDVDEDAPCDVCTLTDSSAGDDMIFCDGCNVCVHLSCYGIDEVPQGDWVCQMCSFGGFGASEKLKCVVCPNKGGAMKLLSDGRRWAHIACALWIPEIRFTDVEKREPIEGIEDVKEERWALKCSVCDLRQGACMQCSFRSCPTSYHVTCAQRSKFHMEIYETHDDVDFISYCKKHTMMSAGRGTDRVDQSDDERDDRSEALRNLESFFYLHVKHEEVAKRLNVFEIEASDVYEYWKLKRMENGGRPLIRCPEVEIEVDERTPILTLPSSADAQPMVRATAEVESMLNTPFQRKAFRFQRIYQSADRGRNAVHLVLKRERAKRHLLETRYAIFHRLFDLDDQPLIPLSQRFLAQYVELLHSDMTKEEIEESDALVQRMERERAQESPRKVNAPKMSSPLKVSPVRMSPLKDNARHPRPLTPRRLVRPQNPPSAPSLRDKKSVKYF